MTTIEQPDLHSYDFHNDPLPVLSRLQRDDPVHLSRHGYWLITRYDDVKAILGDPTRFSSRGAGFGANNPLGERGAKIDGGQAVIGKFAKALSLSFNQQDPPEHRRIRTLVQQAFARGEIVQRDARIREVAGALLAAARGKGVFDVVTDFAFHLPIITASEMIGIATDERERFRKSFEDAGRLMSPVRSQQDWLDALDGVRWQQHYLDDLIAARRGVPAEDLISALIAAEVDGDRLTDAEISATILTIFNAAGTTTERLISSGVWLLLSHPKQLYALRANPALLDTAIEEILRYHHPAQTTSTNRRATVDVELRGKTIRAGDTVRLCLGIANRDPAVFDEPDSFRLSAESPRHLSFGHGIHFCIGSMLARFQAKLAFEMLLLDGARLDLVTTAPVKDPARPDRFRELLVRFGSDQ